MVLEEHKLKYLRCNKLHTTTWKENWVSNVQANSSDWWLMYILHNCPQMYVTRPYWWSFSSVSGNSCVPSGNKPLPELLLTNHCCHMASLGHSELISERLYIPQLKSMKSFLLTITCIAQWFRILHIHVKLPPLFHQCIKTNKIWAQYNVADF